MSEEHSVTDFPNVPQRIIAQIEMRRAGRRKHVFHGGALCSKCLENPPRPNARYCKSCKNADDRARRASAKAARTMGEIK